MSTAITLFERAQAYVLDNLADIDESELSLATPCTGWDLGMLVAHIGDASDAVANLLATGAFTPPPEPVPSADPVGHAVERVRALADAIAADRSESAAYGGASELAAHGWDIARTRRTPKPIPEDLATELLEAARAVVPEAARGSAFGPVVETPPTATAEDRFVAFLGRSAQAADTAMATATTTSRAR